MILRRLSQSLKEQNWMAIGIEFVLLVVGVYLGIQVANWKEARVERELVRGHLTEIAQDLRMHLAIRDELEDSAKLRIAAVDYIYDQAFGIRLPVTLVRASERWEAPPAEAFPPEQLDHLMGAVNLVRISVRSRNGYESLISSGRLGLLKNRKLAHQIQAYYGNFDSLLDVQSNVLRPFRNDGARDQYPLGLSVFDQRPAAEIVALARENPGFAAYLRSQREWAITQYHLMSDINEETAELLAAIEKELAAP
ncbi:hypothetical protein [Arenimonas sp. GDDSR-1]|uniref:hypothetical protein n=1 Tax=Arenimonas sp. GDDSR-1 TaxID=2950125 RepID=UPI00260FE968|nr:hypothetical protein [Arenimonas sp. GDDSR-1]